MLCWLFKFNFNITKNINYNENSNNTDDIITVDGFIIHETNKDDICSEYYLCKINNIQKTKYGIILDDENKVEHVKFDIPCEYIYFEYLIQY